MTEPASHQIDRISVTSAARRARDRLSELGRHVVGKFGRISVRAIRPVIAGLVAVACLSSQLALASDTTPASTAQSAASASPQKARQSRPEPAQDDDATLRRDAWRQWYEGDPTTSYRRFLFEAAKAERHRRAKQVSNKTQSTASNQTMAVATPVWLNLGPTRNDFLVNGPFYLNEVDSGRIASIVVHPTNVNTIYVATAGGGVWKTTNGGQAWVPITDSLGALFIGSLEMDPSEPNTLYLGLGDFADDGGAGIGAVLKSTDAGATWSDGVILQHNSGSATSTATYVKQILASPNTPGLLLAATDIGLFRSVNGGVNWSYVDLPAAMPKIWSIAWTGASNFALSLVNPDGPNGGGEVYFSSDDGTTWVRAAGINKPGGIQRVTLAAAPSNRAIVYALAADAAGQSLADIFRSTNSGYSWSALNADTKGLANPNNENSTMGQLLDYQGWYDQLALVSPGDPNVVYFGGTVFLAQTTDGGATFSQLTNWLAQFGLPYVHADFHCGVFDSAGNLYVGSDGGIFKSTDGGQHWTSALNRGIVSHLVYSVGSSLANRNAVIGGLQDAGTRVRSGATSTFNQTLGGDGFGSNVHAVNPNQVLGSMYFTRIYRSNNGGTSFYPAATGIDTNGAFFTKIVPDLGDPSGNTVYTLTNFTAYRSTDYAGSWTALGTIGLPASTVLKNIGVSKANPQILGLVATQGRVYLSYDGGSSWALAGPSGTVLSSIWFETTNPETIYVTSDARVPGAAHIWKSIDGGWTWTAIGLPGSGLPNVPVHTLVNDPTNPFRLYAGTHFGLYQSDDGGDTWVVAGSGLPLAAVTDIYVAPDSSFVRVSTYGRGFWELETAGQSQDLTLTPESIPDGTAGLAFTPVSFGAIGGTGPYTFSVTAGVLPGGLSLSSSGVLSGTPVMAGSYTFRVTANDSAPPSSGGPFSGSRVYVMTIFPENRLALTPGSLPQGTFQTAYPPQAISASGGISPYSFAVTAGALPDGLVLSGAGVLSGTPQKGGSFSFRLTATDSTPVAAGGPLHGNQNYVLTIQRASQNIAFGPLANRNLGDPDFTIGATATSGLPVQFASFTQAVCTVSGALVHLVSGGTCTIAADQLGNNDYSAANRVTRSFSVLTPDVIAPLVVALTREFLSPTMSDPVYYQVEFSEPVAGVTTDNFNLSSTGVVGAAVTAVYDSGNFWEVEVNTGRGNGTVRVDFTGGPEITDLAGNPLVAVLVEGDTYQVDKSIAIKGAGQGRPDSAFGSNGFALFGEVPIVRAPAVAVLPDGRILAAGPVACQMQSSVLLGLCAVQLARYLASGALDTTFGQNGRVLTAITRVVRVNRLIVNGDGSFHVDGVRQVTGGSANVPFVAMYASNGTPVTTFGSNGLASLDSLPVGNTSTGSAVDDQGRVHIAGTTLSVPGKGTDVFVARLTADGILDTSFGTGGIARLGISTTGSRTDRGRDLAVQSDGSIVVGGETLASANSFDLLLLRLDPGGALDPTFGTGGIATARLPVTGSNTGRRLVLYPDGKISLLGTVQTQCGIVRFKPDGVLDTGWGSNGKLLLSASQLCADIRLQADSKLVVTGINFASDADLYYAAIERVLADGTPDPTFGTAGLIEITSYATPARAAITASGSLVTSLVIEDSNDGLQKSYIVKLAAELTQVTSTTVSAVTPVQAVTGQPYSVSVSVTAAHGTPDGSVKISDDLGANCTVASLSAGTGSCILTSTTTGSRALTAVYSGSPGFFGSTGTKLYVVGKAGSVTSLVASMNPAPAGSPVTFTASTRVTAPGSGVPTGVVTFYDRKAQLGSAPLDADGNATFVSSTLPVGAAKIQAVYGGDANYGGSSSAELKQKIETLPSVQFSEALLKVAETAGSLNLTVSRAGSVAGPVSVAFASFDGTAKAPEDYVQSNGTLNWAAGEGMAKTITITIIADGVPEPAEAFSVTLSAPVGATLGNFNPASITISKN